MIIKIPHGNGAMKNVSSRSNALEHKNRNRDAAGYRFFICVQIKLNQQNTFFERVFCLLLKVEKTA